MDFFAELKEGHPAANSMMPDDLELIMIANAKRMGLSLMELNEFRVCDFLKFMDICMDEFKPRSKQATQDDIDKLLS